MVRMSVSELSTYRLELQEETDALASHGFDAIALWRPKVSDIGSDAVRRLLDESSLTASSLLWGGGFTGADGMTFRDGIEDALEGLSVAATVGAETLVLHSGQRGGHTIGHARRLLVDAIEELLPEAESLGVTLALKPSHPSACDGWSFLCSLQDSIELVHRFDSERIALAVDLWHFADDPALDTLLPELVAVSAVVQLADRTAPPSDPPERLPPGFGTLRLAGLVSAIASMGYRGYVEFDCVGEAAESLGTDGLLRHLRTVATQWLAEPAHAAER
jgi:sugar phosphate isomerase/epimerase